MAGNVNRQILLKKRPIGLPKDSDFAFAEAPIPTPGPGEFVTRNLYISLDPAARGWMDEEGNYFPPIPLGSPVVGGVIGKIVESDNPDFPEGEIVYAVGTWSDYSLLGSSFVFRKIPKDTDIPLPIFISLLGGMGTSALIALREIGRPKKGETLFISGAAGNMGSITGQIGKLMGCRVVGTAGTEDKCRWITSELGFDEAINYKTATDMAAAIKIACPDGIDIYYDNVGGPLLETVLDNININARIIMNGSIAEYNDAEPRPGPHNLWQLLVKRALIEGFLLPDFAEFIEDALVQLEDWYRAGKIVTREDIRDDFENAPAIFRGLFDGTNTGKLMLRLAES